jgi:hypothetical protein
MRSSIQELCKADHGDDPAILGPWLANKTPDQVEGWINANPMGFLVAVGSDGIVAVAKYILTMWRLGHVFKVLPKVCCAPWNIARPKPGRPSAP